MHNGRILKSDKKNNLINFIGKKTVSFSLEKNIINIPENLKRYNPLINNNVLSITYDKNKIKFKEIFKILNENNISFNEINTDESDLEDVFLQLTKNRND